MNQDDDILLETAQKGSFSGAAKALFTTPQAVMKQVNKIEEQAGFRIFNRSPRGITVTRAGERFLDCIRRQQSERNAVIAACREENSNCIRLGLCSNTMYYRLSDVLAAFRKGHPDTMIRFVSTRPANMLEDLQHGKFDACIYPRKPQPVKGMAFYPLVETTAYCVVERTHELAGFEKITYEDLKNRSVCIGTNNRNPEIIANLEAYGIHPAVSTFPPVFVCFDRTVYLTFMKLDALPDALVQIPFDSGFKNVSGILCIPPVSGELEDFIAIAQSTL